MGCVWIATAFGLAMTKTCLGSVVLIVFAQKLYFKFDLMRSTVFLRIISP